MNNLLEEDIDEEQQAVLPQIEFMLSSQIIFSGINLLYILLNVWLNSFLSSFKNVYRLAMKCLGPDVAAHLSLCNNPTCWSSVASVRYFKDLKWGWMER